MPKNPLPSFQFYPGDWTKDTNLRGCSSAARGAWIDMLCLMFEAEQRGVLRSSCEPWSVTKVAKTITRCHTRNVQELIDNGVAKVARRDGAIYSKRMIRDELKRRHKAQSGKKGGKQTASKPEANTQAKPGSSSSSSSSSSKAAEEAVTAPLLKSPQGGRAEAAVKEPPKKKRTWSAPNYTDDFETWWRIYPTRRRRAKSKCFEYWTKYNLEERGFEVVHVLGCYCDSPEWKKNAGQYIPLATTWLEGRLWDISLEEAQAIEKGWRT